jgi:MFS family permease
MTTTLPSPAVERYLFGFFSIGCLLAGYCVGSSNVTLSQQCAGQFSEDADPETSSKLVAAFSVGALAGCLLLMRLGDALGRRRVIRASAHAFLAGSLLTAGCPCPGQRGFDASATTAVLGTGRFLWGLGGALNFQATSQYVAEVMSQENRGFYLPLLSLVVVVGDLCGAAVGATAESLACGWRLAAAAMALPALALAHVANVLPDSPRWLALNAVAPRARQQKRTGQRIQRPRRRHCGFSFVGRGHSSRDE